MCIVCMCHSLCSQNTPVPTAKDTNLDSFDFNDALLSDDETVLASVRMFLDCDLVTKFNIDYKVRGC